MRHPKSFFVFVLIVVFGAIFISHQFNPNKNTIPVALAQETSPASTPAATGCGCNPPPETAHGQNWTDNMCFFPPKTDGCPVTFPGGYCDPNGDGSYADADWVRGYYEYRALCPSNSLTPTRTAPTTTPGVQPTSSQTVDLNKCANYDVEALIKKLIETYGSDLGLRNTLTKLCSGYQNPNVSGGAGTPTTAVSSGTPVPTLPDSQIPQGLDALLNPTDAPPSQYVSHATRCLANKSLYQQAVAMYQQYRTDKNAAPVPWQILSGFHNVETGGSCNPNQSIISGRKIGAAEPDRAGTCSPQDTGPCRTVPVAGGCGYKSFIDAACDGARILVENKLQGSIESIPQLAAGMAGYNGWGNTNCDKCTSIYGYCPASFRGDDHPYPMNWFDQKHATMCLPYCDGDRVLCNPAPVFKRPGGLSIIKWVSYCDKHSC